MNEPFLFLSVKEIAAYLQIHPMTVYKYLKSRKIPATKVGGQWRTRKDVLDKYFLDRMSFNVGTEINNDNL